MSSPEFNAVRRDVARRLTSHLAPGRALEAGVALNGCRSIAAWTGRRSTPPTTTPRQVADSQDYRAPLAARRAQKVRAEPASRLDLRFGERPRATLDYFPGANLVRRCLCSSTAATGSATRRSGFPSPHSDRNAHGINVAVPGYTLAPDARLTEIVAEIRQALTFLAERAGEFGFDPNGCWSAAGRRAGI